ncbi:3-keto-disaccharide hydrolase [Deminuibacter soli]|uniref:DUF1080 domain-containing protein n=1 Tax=Deminuibacter soli TaxID=2291815 RepID=A0A3E1NR93_9BACT|nr:DUF1080 domain-containing protein [Deminuibacter soli]RFM30417.1 DUF1080 domain-containing protein [Deminuibacter soli]
MKNILAGAAALAFVTLTSFAPKGKSEGFKPLFDGKTTTGWHTYGQKGVTGGWQAENGTLHFAPNGKKGGDIVTDGVYGDFDLKLEWKISANGNSGIIFYVYEDTTRFKSTYNTGMEMQVLDNDGHPDGKIHKHRAGDLYDLIPSSTEPVKPVGEWNQVEIISKKGQLEFYLNGTKVVSTTLWNDQWKQLIAGSKFKDMPGFGTYKEGHIALQDHGNEVWYRNIEIKKL